MIAENPDNIEQKFRFLVVDDHPLFREALMFAVKAAYAHAQIAECSTFDEALVALKADGPYDLALLDLRLPGSSGFDGILKLRTMYPRLPIVIVSGLEDPEIVKTAMSYGIAGFIPKSTKKDELTTAITSVMNGEIFLPGNLKKAENIQPGNDADEAAGDLSFFTPQQLRVVGMIRNGLLNKQIAYELGVSETTVKAHVSKILKKLGVTNRTQAAMEIEKLNSSELINAHDQLDD